MANENEEVSSSHGESSLAVPGRKHILIDLTKNSTECYDLDNDVIFIDVSSPDVIMLPDVVNSHSAQPLVRNNKENKCSALGKEKCLDTSCQTEKIISCGVCLEDLLEVQSLDDKQAVSTVCGHLFCTNCIKTAIRTCHKCPVCRKRLGVKSYHPIYI